MLNAAIIGLGYHGKRLMSIIQKMAELNLTAVVDTNEEAFCDVGFKNEKQYTDIKELFSYHILDLLVITTTGPSHYKIAKYAIENGVKKLFITKPITTTLAEARHLIKLAAQNDVRITVDHGLRHDKTYSWIRKNIKLGIWGELRSIYIMREGIGLGCVGIHSFDLINSLVEDEIDSVVGWIDAPIGINPRGAQFIDPGGLAVLNYKNGVKAIVSQIEDGSGPISVEINLTCARIQINEKFGEVKIVKKIPNTMDKLGKSVQYEQVEIPEEFAVSHNLFVLMKSVLIDLIDEGPLKCEASHGEKSLEILVATYLSNERGHQPVTLPLTDERDLTKFISIT